jgi:hypothetical protein
MPVGSAFEPPDVILLLISQRLCDRYNYDAHLDLNTGHIVLEAPNRVNIVGDIRFMKCKNLCTQKIRARGD